MIDSYAAYQLHLKLLPSCRYRQRCMYNAPPWSLQRLKSMRQAATLTAVDVRATIEARFNNRIGHSGLHRRPRTRLNINSIPTPATPSSRTWVPSASCLEQNQLFIRTPAEPSPRWRNNANLHPLQLSWSYSQHTIGAANAPAHAHPNAILCIEANVNLSKFVVSHITVTSSIMHCLCMS